MTLSDFLIKYEMLAYLIIIMGAVIGIIFLIKWIIERKKPKEDINWDALKTDVKNNDQKVLDELAELNAPKKKLKKVSKIVANKKVKAEKIIKPHNIIEDTIIKPFDIIKSKPFFSYERLRDWVYDRYFPAKVLLVHMELLNGFHRLFLVKEKEDGFIFRSKKFVFDDDCKYYNLDAKLFTYDYHEGLALPIKRKIPLTHIHNTISASGSDIEYAINPSTLQRFMTAKIAEGVMKGTQLDEFLRKLQMFLIVIMVLAAVHLALFVSASGMLEGMQIPFV